MQNNYFISLGIVGWSQMIVSLLDGDLGWNLRSYIPNRQAWDTLPPSDSSLSSHVIVIYIMERLLEKCRIC